MEEPTMKKLIALSMTVVMVLSLGVAAFANPATDAGIEFETLNDGDGPFDPDEPGENPPDVNLPPDVEDGFRNMNSMSLDFHLHNILEARARFGNDPFLSYNGSESDDNDTLGIGILSESTPSWVLTVNLPLVGFVSGLETGHLNGFTMDLEQREQTMVGATALPLVSAGSGEFSFMDVVLMAGGTETIATGGIGVFGMEFNGILDIPEGADAEPLEYQVDMIWSFGPPVSE
jgi:hypothetical protein